MKQIYLTKGMVASIDDDDFEKVNKYSWHCTSHGYAAARINNKIVYMHRYIMNSQGAEIDHIDNDRLNNKKQNLRSCKHIDNIRNSKTPKNSTTGYKGVTFAKWAGLYRAHIIADGNNHSLGYFKDAKEAAISYNKAAIKYFGEFAKLNEV
jgi:hypothetical protein